MRTHKSVLHNSWIMCLECVISIVKSRDLNYKKLMEILDVTVINVFSLILVFVFKLQFSEWSSQKLIIFPAEKLYKMLLIVW